MAERIYVAWRDPIKMSWYPVGVLRLGTDSLYRFVYTKGALLSGFPLFPRMTKVEEYTSPELFPLFANRTMSVKRPDYGKYMKWLEIKADELSPMKMLLLTEGIKPTDYLEFFQCPIKSEDNNYDVHFIVHGLQYFPKEVLQRVNELKEGERLFLVPDPQNQWYKDAVLVRTGDPIFTIGYCPRYLSRDFKKLLNNGKVDVNDISVTVRRVNKDAPLNLRLLCQINAPWPDDFQACDQEEFDPILSELGLPGMAKTGTPEISTLHSLRS